MQRTWIIIVNYRTAELVSDCLSSLESEVDDLGGGRVVVVDNDSGDSSVDELATLIAHEGWDSWAEVSAMDRNGGFAFGNNAGIKIALASNEKPDYILLLNPDTVVRNGAIKHLVDFLESHPNAGIAGSSIENTNGEVEVSAHSFPSPLSELEGSARLGLITRLFSRYVVSPPIQCNAHECDWISGASFLFRREVYETIGQMDDSFFLYFEEVDFCQRAKNKGWSTWFVPESRVVHLEGAATGISSTVKRRPSYWYNSRRRYLVKHYGVSGWLVADLLWLIGRLSYLFRRFLQLGAQGANKDPKWFMFDLLVGDFLALITGTVFKIKRVGVKKIEY